MEHLLGALAQGFAHVVQWPGPVYLVAGTLIGMLFGVLPGVSSITAMALSLSLTLEWDLVPVMIFFMGLQGATSQGGSLTSILFGIPGDSPNAATIIDGYELARQGKARTAIGASATASAMGASFGLVVLVGLIPAMQRFLLAFGPAEFLAITLFGLSLIALVSQRSLAAGLASGGLGVLLSFVGSDPATGAPRFTFGLDYLWAGIPLVPALLGIFALGEVLDMVAARRASIADPASFKGLGGSTLEGVRAVFRHFGIFLRSAVIGTVVGAVPGVGGPTAAFVAYGQAAATSRGGRFGQGDIRGVIAPEASADAKDGGALIPTLAFGLPGSSAMALVLAALLLHGVVPGPELLGPRLDVVFTMVVALFFSNWLTSALAILAAPILAQVTVIRSEYLVATIVPLAAVAAYAEQGQVADILLMVGFGALGFLMKQHGFSRIALVIGLVLGAAVEQNLLLLLDLQAMGRLNVLHRPIAILLFLATAVLVVGSAVQQMRQRRPAAGALTQEGQQA